MSASHAADRRPAITMAWEWGALGLLYVLVRNLPKSRAESATLAGAVIATAVALAAYGLYQIPVEFPQIRAAFLRNPEAILLSQGIEPGSPSADAYRSRLMDSNEPFSTFALANSLAGFLVGPMALVLAVALDNLRREGRGSRLVVLALAAVPGLVMLTCLVLTKSRSAYVGLFAATLVLAWRARKAVPARALFASGSGWRLSSRAWSRRAWRPEAARHPGDHRGAEIAPLSMGILGRDLGRDHRRPFPLRLGGPFGLGRTAPGTAGTPPGRRAPSGRASARETSPAGISATSSRKRARRSRTHTTWSWKSGRRPASSRCSRFWLRSGSACGR